MRQSRVWNMNNNGASQLNGNYITHTHTRFTTTLYHMAAHTFRPSFLPRLCWAQKSSPSRGSSRAAISSRQRFNARVYIKQNPVPGVCICRFCFVRTFRHQHHDGDGEFSHLFRRRPNDSINLSLSLARACAVCLESSTTGQVGICMPNIMKSEDDARARSALMLPIK